MTQRCLVYGWATKSASVNRSKQKNQCSAAREQAQHSEWEEGTKQRTEKKDEHISRFELFLHRETTTVHKVLCMRNTICVHLTCMVVTMHAIFGGLPVLIFFENFVSV